MKKILLAVMLTGMFAACNDSDDEFISATVVDYGAPETDGCGWMIDTGTEILKPINLSGGFKKSDLHVRIEFRKLESEYLCGFLPTPFQEIKIVKIMKEIH